MCSKVEDTVEALYRGQEVAHIRAGVRSFLFDPAEDSSDVS